MYDNKTGLESQDGDNEKTSSNPFYLNFDMFCRKSLEYDISNLSEELNFWNGVPNKISE